MRKNEALSMFSWLIVNEKQSKNGLKFRKDMVKNKKSADICKGIIRKTQTSGGTGRILTWRELGK